MYGKSVSEIADELNIPIVSVAGSAMNKGAFLTIDASDIICEAVKPAELIDNAYVLRLYECERNTSKATVKLSRPCKKAWSTNMLEDKKEELAVIDNTIDLTFKPFEIKTILIEE